jgi:hypothetical protein
LEDERDTVARTRRVAREGDLSRGDTPAPDRAVTDVRHDILTG